VLSPQWRRLDDAQAFYRYQPYMGESEIGTASPPVVFLNPLPVETNNPLAELFWADGFLALYSYATPTDDDETARRLGQDINQLLATQHPAEERVILVGCAGGGLLGRRYVMLGGSLRVAYLFTLGSAHNFSQLAYLGESIFEPYEVVERVRALAPSNLDHTVQVNIYSELLAASPEAMGQGVHLPDAVNVALPIGHEALCRDELTYRVMHQYLLGEQWLVTVRLQSLNMHGDGEDASTGPFCFEVNGLRAPFDGAFRVPLDRRFTFEPARTLLGTLTFPLTAAGRAVDIDFRLKDLSPQRGQRRKLLTSLHTPLRAGVLSEHLLQDSLGSEVGIQVRCDRPQPILENHND